MQPLPFGVAGNVFIGGPSIGRGYLRDREKTAAKFVQNPLAGAPRESAEARALRLELVAPTAAERAAAVRAIVAADARAGHYATPLADAALSAVVYSTGDRGRLTAGDQLELRGRAIQEIKIRGYKVNPATVTAALKGALCPGVSRRRGAYSSYVSASISSAVSSTPSRIPPRAVRRAQASAASPRQSSCRC
jgi:non-ribosomal peptide synthetase component F